MKKHRIILMGILFLMTANIAYAASFSDIDVSVNRDEEQVVIKGHTSSKRSGVFVSAQIISPCEFDENATWDEIDKLYNKKLEDICAKNLGSREDLVFAGQAVSKKEGEFELPVTIKGESGLYLIRAASGDDNDIYSKYIRFYTKEYIDNIVKQINESTSSEQILEILDKEVYNQDMETELYDAVKKNTDIKPFINKILQADDFKSFGELENFYAYNLAGYALECGNPELFALASEKYADILRLGDYKIYDTYMQAFTQKDKDNVLNRFKSEQGTKYEERFAKAAFMAGIERLTSWTQISDYLKTNANGLLNITNYIGNTAEADKIIINGTYNGRSFMSYFKDFAEAFQNIMRDVNASKGTGGGGSGSSGGSSTPVTLPGSIDKNSGKTEKEYFPDLDSVPWAKEAVTALAEAEIVNGMDSGNFEPNLNVTREQFISMLVKALDINAKNVELDFMDVNTDSWYYSAVAAAYANGIINGKDDGSLGIGENITREDMAVMAYRALKLSGNEACTFKDSEDISEYARDAVGTMSKLGIINGFDDNTFGPKSHATRAQAAKIVYEIYKNRK